MFDFFFELTLIVLGVGIGGYIMLAGRRKLGVTLGIVGLMAGAELVAVLALSLDSGWSLLREREWMILLLILGFGVIGYLIGRRYTDLSVILIGFLAWANIALWFNAIVHYVSTDVIAVGAETAVYFNIPIFIIGGLIGAWFTRLYNDKLLIIITVILGVRLIGLALSLDNDSSFTAVVILSLALIGIVVQYAQYLRELKTAESLPPAPQPALPEIGWFYDKR
jgi:hypothetical protein